MNTEQIVELANSYVYEHGWKRLADECGVKNWQNVQKWVANRRVPVQHVPAFAQALGDPLTVEDVVRMSRMSWLAESRLKTIKNDTTAAA